MNNREIIKKTKDKDPLERKELILALMAQQRKMFDDLGDMINPDPDRYTLYDIENCVLAGSSVCPHCKGFMGRLDEFYETAHHSDNESE